jgi:hypothetical protein
MKITSSWYFRIALGLLCVVVIFEAALLSANFHTRRRAQALLASFRSLKIGASTVEEIEPILTSYNAQRGTTANCYSLNAESYSIWVTNATVDHLGYTFPMLLRLGVRPVSFTAMLSFADGRLCQARYSSTALVSGSEFSDEQRKGMKAIELTASTRIDASQGASSQSNYNVHNLESLLRGLPLNGSQLGIEARVTSAATPTEMERAMTFDFSCFTSFGGCNALKQMMPLASADAGSTRKLR